MTLFRHGLVAGIGLLFVTFAPVRGDDEFSCPSPRATDIDQKLKSIVVSVDFTNASIDDAIRALVAMSKESDPDHKGINFLVSPEASVAGKPITLKLDKVPLGATLRYVCELGSFRYNVDDQLVSIIPAGAIVCGIEKRTFHVDPSFLEILASTGVNPTVKAP